MKLISKNIQGVDFSVEIALNSNVCILLYDGDNFFFEDVDLAQMVRAVQNSATIEDMIENTKGIWREEKLLPVLKSYALEVIPTDDFIRVLTESDEWTKRKMNTLSNLLGHINELDEFEKWLKYRGMMFDAIQASGVLE